jgi:Flp pilus assembly pilin Flp
MTLLKKILVAEDGTTAVEYALLVALLILACIATLHGIGDGLRNIYDKIDTTVP